MPPLQEYRSAMPQQQIGPERAKLMQMLAQYKNGGVVGWQSPFPTATRGPQIKQRSPWNIARQNMGARMPQPMLGPGAQQPLRQDNDLIRRLMTLRQGPMVAQPAEQRQLR